MNLIILFFILVFIIYKVINLYKSHENQIKYEHYNDNTMCVNDTKKIKSYGYACDCNKHEIINYVERFGDTWFAPDSTWLAKNNLQAWWNSTRHTRGMSYDLRGDIPIPLPNTFYP